MKFTGEIKITLEYDDVHISWHESRNSISDGIAYGLTNLFSSKGAEQVTDFSVNYFQLGQGTLSSYLPSQTTLKNFYSLASAFTASDYGASSTNTVVSSNQIVPSGGNFSSPVSYTASTAVFIEIPPENKNTFYTGGLSTRLIVDKATANGKTISEIGLFMKNPDGNFGVDSSIMMAYKTFNPIVKSEDFRIIIDWNLFVTDGNLVGNFDSASDSIQRITFDFLSGVGEFQTSDFCSERFELIIPSAFALSGNPLVVAFHGLGNSMTQWRSDTTNSYYGRTDREINKRGWFYLAPLGRTTSSLTFNTLGNNAVNTGTAYYTHSKAIMSPMNSNIALNHTVRVVNYITSRYPIDKRRIYFLGHSNGGACAMSFASKLLDTNTSAFQVAGVIGSSPQICMRRAWWEYAPASFGATTLWAAPNANGLRDTATAVIFWTAAQGNFSYIPSALVADTGLISSIVSPNYGTLWPTVSALTPSDTPHYYNELNCVDYNLLTSSNFSFSTCTLFNLQHIPFYHHFFTDDDQGGWLYEPNLILSSFLTSTGIFNNYKCVPSTVTDLTNIIPIFASNHTCCSLNINDALDYMASAYLTAPTQASTIVTRSGRWWWFDCTLKFSDLSSSSLLSSGLGIIIWRTDLPTNTLWLSGTRNITDTNNVYNKFDYVGAGFNPSLTNPLKIYNVSGLSQFPVNYDSGQNTVRRIGLANLSNPSKLTYFNYSGNNIGVDGIVCTLSGSNWSAAGVGTVAVIAANGTDLLIRRVGYYEIVP